MNSAAASKWTALLLFLPDNYHINGQSLPRALVQKSKKWAFASVTSADIFP
jgi:hypothetical protein